MEEKQNIQTKSVIKRNLDEHSSNTSKGPTRKTIVSVNKTSIDFDKTDVGDECFRLIKISQDGERMPVTLSSDSPDTFRIAIGVNKLVFEDTLTFTPVEAGTFVHVRFTPDRMGQHAGSLTLKTDNGQQTITLNGRGGSYIATPASEQIKGSSGWKWAAILALVGGISYVGYTYRCQLVPSLCDQISEVQRVNSNPKPSLPSPVPTITNGELETETVESPKGGRVDRVLEAAPSVARPERQTSGRQTPTRDERNQERKAETGTTRRQQSKPAQKSPSASDESELERELNKKPGI